MKYNSIDQRPDKVQLRSEPGNFEIDSLIGKNRQTSSTNSYRYLPGKFYIRFYDRAMEVFKEAFKFIIKKHNLSIKTLTMDNGGENNKLHEILPKEIMFNYTLIAQEKKGR